MCWPIPPSRRTSRRSTISKPSARRIWQQLEALQAQINASKNEEKTLLAEKSELEQEITLLDSSIETNETLMEQYRFQIESNEIALDALEQELADEMEIYGQVLCYYAKYGEASTFEILVFVEKFFGFSYKT